MWVRLESFSMINLVSISVGEVFNVFIDRPNVSNKSKPVSGKSVGCARWPSSLFISGEQSSATGWRRPGASRYQLVGGAVRSQPLSADCSSSKWSDFFPAHHARTTVELIQDCCP